MEYGAEEANFKVYPDAPGTAARRRPTISSDEAGGDAAGTIVPEAVWRMYNETVEALNANIRTLAGAGLRAVVEAMCLDKKMTEGSLEKKSTNWRSRTTSPRRRRNCSHEERHLGNAALHEQATPSSQDIEDGLRIVEGLMS